MAQILKEEVRERILQAGCEQLLKYGEAATMRQIAQAAGITPGNLYRYYAGKEELIAAIISPLVTGMDAVLREATGQNLALGQKELPPLPNGSVEKLIWQEFYPLMREMLVQTAALCREYPRQAAVLMRMESAGRRLIGWFRQIMDQALMRLVLPQNTDRQRIEMLADAECRAFCAGVEVLFQQCGELEQARAEALIESYLYIHVQGLTALLQRAFEENVVQPREEAPHAGNHETH